MCLLMRCSCEETRVLTTRHMTSQSHMHLFFTEGEAGVASLIHRLYSHSQGSLEANLHVDIFSFRDLSEVLINLLQP